MSTKILDNINRNVILQAVNELPDQFSTKDVSENVNVINAHPKLYKHTHYHAFIGKFLQNKLYDHDGNKILIEIASKRSRGSVWQKANSFKKEEH